MYFFTTLSHLPTSYLHFLFSFSPFLPRSHSIPPTPSVFLSPFFSSPLLLYSQRPNTLDGTNCTRPSSYTNGIAIDTCITELKARYTIIGTNLVNCTLCCTLSLVVALFFLSHPSLRTILFAVTVPLYSALPFTLQFTLPLPFNVQFTHGAP